MRKDAAPPARPPFVRDEERPKNKGHSFRLSYVRRRARPEAGQTHKQQWQKVPPPSESLKNQSKAKGCCCTVADHIVRIVQKLKICDSPFRLVKYGFSKRSFFERLFLFLNPRGLKFDV